MKDANHDKSTHYSSPGAEFKRLLDIVKTLRGPNGCPWDKEQSARTLRGDLLEETYECIDAINSHDSGNLREELGDLFLLATMISYIEQQAGRFTVTDVLDEISEKLIRRHPHVFSDSTISGSEEVIQQWDRIKRDVEGKDSGSSLLDSVPGSLPPLEKAYRYQKKAAKVGFDWEELSQVSDKVHEELQELEEIDPQNGSHTEVENELGDLLFAVVNLCRHYKVDPAIALHGTNRKFARRFRYIEEEMKSRGKALSTKEFSLMDTLWNEAKSFEEG